MIDSLLDDLVLANRILFHQGVVDAYGHVSARDPRDPERFLIARHVAPALVTRDDIMTFDLEGRALDANGRTPYTEVFIHAAIYAARPDVHGVVHSHSPAIIPFGVSDVPLRPIAHVCAFLGEGVARFDTQDAFGDTDLLIRDLALGEALARALGPHPVALMRGHGSVAVGVTLRQAVYRAIYTEVNARLQTEALRLGGSVRYLTSGETALMGRHQDPAYQRPWALWVTALGEGFGVPAEH
jgi:ribulose-5-phosphate 4-epimerase/fuculose-1-phosphate aldolase